MTFGSLLLLAGRLGDLAGRKRIFLAAGVVIFTVASLLCGIAPSEGALIGARLLQGVGAAAQASVILAIIVTEFPEAAARARAMSAYVFVSVAGGSLGLLAGGLLTETLSWHWVFFVNLPIGVATFALGQALIRGDRGLGFGHGVDWLGSLLVTVSLMSGIYAIIEATNHGWISAQVFGIGAVVRGADGQRSWSSSRGSRTRSCRCASCASRRARQREPRARLPRDGDVLNLLPRDPLPRAGAPLHAVGDRCGIPALDADRRDPLAGHHRLARRALRRVPRADERDGARRRRPAAVRDAGPDTAFFPTFFLACLLIGLGIGVAFMPLLTLAMADVPAKDAGLASGITNVSQQLSGAFGLAVLSTVASNHTKSLLADGHGSQTR